MKNNFKISRLDPDKSPKEKRQWLEIVEENKKRFLTQKSATVTPDGEMPTSPAHEVSNPFSGSDSDNEESLAGGGPALLKQFSFPPWILEAPEEIDVLLAQRDFVQAQKLLTPFFIGRNHFLSQIWEYGLIFRSGKYSLCSPGNQNYLKIIFFSSKNVEIRDQSSIIKHI